MPSWKTGGCERQEQRGAQVSSVCPAQSDTCQRKSQRDNQQPTCQLCMNHVYGEKQPLSHTVSQPQGRNGTQRQGALKRATVTTHWRAVEHQTSSNKRNVSVQLTGDDGPKTYYRPKNTVSYRPVAFDGGSAAAAAAAVSESLTPRASGWKSSWWTWTTEQGATCLRRELVSAGPRAPWQHLLQT